ncbi:MAG TPA: immunoglobulin domain-containing protein, partial [Candidatus Sulfotelmatobacter sp.]|nr:immunoglobulin domain-containing protein [Candidatus Sulfotelmatobacter sp.]
GKFQTLAGQPRNGFGRLNADGSLDAAFDPKVSVGASALVPQADGKILVAGTLTAPDGQTRTNLGRLNADGSLDAAFDPKLIGFAFSLTVQADGKILVGGQFTRLGGQTRTNLGRLNADGSLDTTFNPSADSIVSSLAVQPDGRILAGGYFRTLGGQTRKCIGRLNNTEPASQSLRYEGATLTWWRGGAGPEVLWTLFDYSTNGLDWTWLGTGTRVPGGAYQLSGVSLPPNATVRARGYVCATGGLFNAGSGWLVEQMSGPPAVSFAPDSSVAQAGTTVRFNLAAGGSEPLGYQWRKDGVALAEGGGISGTSTPVLSLSNVFKKDEGSYSVVVSNLYGSITSAVARLTVVDPAIAVQPLADNDKQVGQSISLEVGVVGTAPLVYQWWKDGQALAQGTAASLVLTNLHTTDAGHYWMVATNPYGSTTSTVARLGVSLPTLETAFNPGADYSVWALALQADGKILVGGEFRTLGGQVRNGLGRLHDDGSLDTAFDPAPNAGNDPVAYSLAVQPDG